MPTAIGFIPEAIIPFPFFTDPASSPTLSQSLAFGSNIDWSQIKTGFLMQYEPSTLGPLNNFVLGPAATISDLALINGTTNAITETLQPSLQTALSVNVPGSQWAGLFTNASTAAPTQYASGLSVIAEPYVTGTDTVGGLGNLTLAGTALQMSGFGFGFQIFGGCDSGFPFIGNDTQPAILTDQDLATLQYGDPFPAPWTRALSFCQEAIVPIPLPDGSSTVNYALVNETRVDPTHASFAPIIRPVQAPTINSGDLFTTTMLNTTTPTLAWSAPSGAAPYGYRVQLYTSVTLSGGTVIYAPAGTYSTAKTSLALLPLTAGKTYVFSIITLANAGGNIETSFFRSALPTGLASVISGPVPISSGAPTVTIRGNAKVVRQLSQGKAPDH